MLQKCNMQFFRYKKSPHRTMRTRVAPQVGLEPTTLRLTAACSTGWTIEDYTCWHLLIFPGRHQPSIFSTTDLNFCVRNGNRCTLGVINTNYFYYIHFFIRYSCWRLLIFPGRHQPSIFSTTDLNFCVRNGNRCTLSVINTNLFILF